MNCELQDKVFNCVPATFNETALSIFNYQYNNNALYREFVNALNIPPSSVSDIRSIPFLPISFFKTKDVVSGSFDPEVIFESSGTTHSGNSRHFVKDISVYRESFFRGFELFYGNPADWCIIGLLPSYLERNNSSLVMMVDGLIKESKHEHSGFYLNEFERLAEILQKNEAAAQKSMLIGVTFALLDFTEKFHGPLAHTIVMETGGMKGKRKEITRLEVHSILKSAWNLSHIHSEYGMTELLSQAYSKGGGIFNCPPWMKIMIRDEDDPFSVKDHASNPVNGLINVIDLANIHSCSFIATDDIGKLFSDGSFEIIGRMDTSDVRGCSLMYDI